MALRSSADSGLLELPPSLSTTPPPPRFRSLHKAGIPLSVLSINEDGGEGEEEAMAAAEEEGDLQQRGLHELELDENSNNKGQQATPPPTTTPLMQRLLVENSQLRRQVMVQGKRLAWLESRYDLLNWRLCGFDSWPLKGHHQLGVLSCRLSPVEGFLASGSADKCILHWDMKNSVCVQRLRGHTGAIHSLHSEGNVLVSGSADKTICFWNFTTGEFIGSLKGHRGAIYSALLRQGLVVSGSADRTIRLWSFSPQPPSSANKLNNGSTPTGGEEEEEEVGQVIRSLEGHCGSVSSLCLHPWDEKVLFSGSYDACVSVWDLETGTMVRMMRGHESFVNAVTCGTTPESSNLLASASNDCTVRLWDVRAGTAIVAMQKHTDWVKDVQIQGSVMVTAGKEGTVMFWDYLYHDCFRVFKAHQHEIHRLQFQDNLLITASEDRTLKVSHFKKLVL